MFMYHYIKADSHTASNALAPKWEDHSIIAHNFNLHYIKYYSILKLVYYINY